MEDLKIVDVYEKSNERKTKKFNDNVNSSMRILIDYEKTVKDTEWIDMMELTIPYIDNIFRNPNRFIINEEEIVKIELARRITVDSIKHLAKHTNFIQEIDKKNGDVKPSKILNINKEESYNTYENRLIYTLVQNMKAFVNQKKEILANTKKSPFKDEKLVEYQGNSNSGNEEIEMTFSIKTRATVDKSQSSEEGIEARIERLEQKIRDLTSTEVYKILEKEHVALVRPPIRKTNVILKNVNFQYAVKLWNYLQDNLEDSTKKIKDKKDYMEEGELRNLTNETFLLDYLIVNKLNKDEQENEEENEEAKDELIDKLLGKILDLDLGLSEDQLKDMIGRKFAIIKYKKMATMQEIQKIFSTHIDKYLEKIEG